MNKERVTWVYDVLKPGQLTTAKRMQHIGRRRLSPLIILLLWVLRLYLVLMFFIIGYQIWTVLHGAK
jgi:hypothetical protein